MYRNGILMCDLACSALQCLHTPIYNFCSDGNYFVPVLDFRERLFLLLPPPLPPTPRLIYQGMVDCLNAG